VGPGPTLKQAWIPDLTDSGNEGCREAGPRECPKDPLAGERFHIPGGVPHGEEPLGPGLAGPTGQLRCTLPSFLRFRRKTRPPASGKDGADGRTRGPELSQGIGNDRRSNVQASVLDPRKTHIAYSPDGHVDHAGDEARGRRWEYGPDPNKAPPGGGRNF
jgi:hypothetical protein